MLFLLKTKMNNNSTMLSEAFLNDLLECSVCLEQLDSSSKVLPCQHTFCKRCLYDILNSHKELRCPECRILVYANIEKLPCNILLVRLLEGIKNNVQPKKIGSSTDIATRSADSSSSSQQSTPFHPQLPQPMGNFLRMPSVTDLRMVPKQDEQQRRHVREKEDPEQQIKLLKRKLEDKVRVPDEDKDFDLSVNIFDKDGHNHKMVKLGFGLDDDSATCDQKQTNPHVGALRAVQPIQAAAAWQTAPHMVSASLNYGKGNPVVSPPTAKTGLMSTTQQMQAQMQKPMSQMMPVAPNRMFNMGNVACWEGSGYAQNPQPHQNPRPNPQLGPRQPTQLIGGPNNMPNSIGNSAMGPPQVMSNPGPSLGGMQSLTQSWQQLPQTLKSPPSAQQQQQVDTILKSKPQLMAAFIKQSCVQEQQQQPIGNSAMGPPRVMPDPGPSVGGMQRPTQAWKLLLETLKSPPSAQQQQQVLAILKSNPQLMAAFIKQRTQQQQQQILLNERNIAPPPQSVWYKQLQQQHLLAVQRQQQQQPTQFPHP